MLASRTLVNIQRHAVYEKAASGCSSQSTRCLDHLRSSVELSSLSAARFSEYRPVDLQSRTLCNRISRYDRAVRPTTAPKNRLGDRASAKYRATSQSHDVTIKTQLLQPPWERKEISDWLIANKSHYIKTKKISHTVFLQYVCSPATMVVTLNDAVYVVLCMLMIWCYFHRQLLDFRNCLILVFWPIMNCVCNLMIRSKIAW